MTKFMLESARTMRAEGLSWPEIGRQLGLSTHLVRLPLDEKYAENFRRWKLSGSARLQHERRVNGGHTGIRRSPVNRVDVVERNPLYDPARDGPLPEHETLTAWVCKDPRPGRSALDQRRMRE